MKYESRELKKTLGYGKRVKEINIQLKITKY